MIIPKRKPVTVGQILSSKMLEPMGITQQQLANTISVSRKTVNELCRDRRTLTTDIAFRLSGMPNDSPTYGNTKTVHRTALFAPSTHCKIKHQHES